MSASIGIASGSHRIAIDVGGTFTDCVVVDERSGSLDVVKVLSTPSDPSQGFMNGIRRALSQIGIEPGEVSQIFHATTVATNAIIEKRLAPTALVVTRGFGDILEIGRQTRPRLYDLDAMKPVPLVPRHLCLEVGGRVASDGSVIAPLALEDLDAAIEAIDASGVEAVVVCFLNSFANPGMEQEAAERIRARLPGLVVSASQEVCPQIGEYARACTALVNAGLVPHISFYFERLEAALAGIGVRSKLQVMKSDGGLLPAAQVSSRPVEIIESGPAAGVVGAAEIARRFALSRVICFDMGGTTAKAGLVIDGQPILSPSFEVGDSAVARVEINRGGGYPIKAPVIDLVEVGAGGGSIAWIDAGGAMRVGPRSAGADPGPACYGRGGREPTVTDANVVLGRIDPGYFLGGEIALDLAAARSAVETSVAAPLGVSVPKAALGILEVANSTMLGALRMVSVQRGFDSRDFTLICSGGAASLQADALMKHLGVRQTFIPPSPGVGTARGMLFANVRREFRMSFQSWLGPDAAEGVRSVLRQLEEKARSAFPAGRSPVRLTHAAEIRFVGQSYQFLIPFSDPALPAQEIARLAQDFRAEHRRQYGFAPDDPVEIVELVLIAVSELPPPVLRPLEPSREGGVQAMKGRRDVWFAADGSQSTAIYERGLLGAGDVVAGPAIIEAPDSTILVGRGNSATVDAQANIVISKTQSEEFNT